ncbi:Dihydrolipoyllysine-residue acetyltransferase component of acetoin cleaving system [Falsiruegeria litorea R37]|uniref:Dihydrolipoyllysine-residue acetyltransferase component of acetoin cleaving system n=1 Tax=Falsiruegeria litorea R37 TaxID=1200284 RepID=A0A1Y5R7T3_9RHOB|nr:alpha/beta hydrolase [Falsiruegeria litorea]SLN10803.1 Dihydrolipoyllysine-residue acetyltransferase component of acetoin cleaving system [Falsiruegeria litorea R37]
MPETSTLHRGACQIGDVTLSYVERHADERGQGPTLLFAHATGFHARIWDQVISHLPAVHSVCVDLHGHGQSTGGPFSNWSELGDEVSEFIQSLGLSNLVCIGHSLGGHVLTQATVQNPQAVGSLLLVDPVIMNPEIYALAETLSPKGAQHPAAQRKRNFTSVQEMVDRFRNRSPYSLFTPQALQDYCQHGLLPTEGGLTLACPPEVEASSYMLPMTGAFILDHLDQIACPVTVLRGHTMDLKSFGDFTRSPTWPGLADALPNGTDVHRPDLSHFMPMQNPAFVADHVARAALLDQVQPA